MIYPDVQIEASPVVSIAADIGTLVWVRKSQLLRSTIGKVIRQFQKFKRRCSFKSASVSTRQDESDKSGSSEVDKSTQGFKSVRTDTSKYTI